MLLKLFSDYMSTLQSQEKLNSLGQVFPLYWPHSGAEKAYDKYRLNGDLEEIS